MKDTFWRTMTIIAAVALTLWGITWLAEALSQPDTGAVIVGIVGVLGLIVAWRYFLRWLITAPPTNSTGPRAVLTALALSALLFGGACTRIEAGHVGIKVNYSGTDRGVDSYPVVTGWVFFLPGATGVFEWPTFMQNAVWTAEDNRQSPGNEELCFNSKEGLAICGDFSISLYLKPEQIPHFYVKFRTDDLSGWMHGYLHNVVRDEATAVASKMEIEQIYGEGKEAFLMEVRKRTQDKIAGDGGVIDQFGIIGRLRLPKIVEESLNQKIAATQDAIKAENQLRQTEAEAKKRIANAQGEAESNRLVQQTITPELIRWRQLDILREKWDGKYPQVVGGESSNILIGLGAGGKP